MFRISLVNMPFAGLNMPSLALTQLKAVVDDEFKDRVSTEILYFNQDFAVFFGFAMTELISSSSEAQNSDVGNWIFRQSAFPQVDDNTDAYFQRFFPVKNERVEAVKRAVLDKRRQLDQFMDQLIAKYQLDKADLVGFMLNVLTEHLFFCNGEKAQRTQSENNHCNRRG